MQKLCVFSSGTDASKLCVWSWGLNDILNKQAQPPEMSGFDSKVSIFAY